MAKHHIISLDDWDWDEAVKRTQEAIKRGEVKRFSRFYGTDCFDGRDIKFCSAYGTPSCVKKCDYARQKQMEDFWKEEESER